MTDKIIINVARLIARAIALVVTRIAFTLAAIVIIPIQFVADIVMIVIRLAKTPTKRFGLTSPRFQTFPRRSCRKEQSCSVSFPP